MSDPNTQRINVRIKAAVRLTQAWAMSRAHQKISPSVDEMMDAFESFHEQLIVTEANQRATYVQSQDNH